ncbi:MAG: CocE/NonD family hydrolase [Pseudomonadales bacterium]|jgi:predicted acyl esterase|nr:CocE/NonD family hydrolase [Pseudomonadales bacterium]
MIETTASPRRVRTIRGALASLLAAWLLLGTHARAAEAASETIVIPLRDGTRLLADVFVPGSGRYPVVLEITPYGRGPEGTSFRGEARYWNAHGYAFVLVDARGTGDSGGEFAFFTHAGQDGREVVARLAAQPFSDGRIVMRGASYSGTNQLLTAATGAPALRCLAPAATGGPDPIVDVVYHDGVFQFAWALDWPTRIAGSPLPRRSPDWPGLLARGTPEGADVAALGAPSPLYRAFLEHGPGASFWNPARLVGDGLERISQPALLLAGWYDGTLDGTLEQFAALQATRPGGHDLHLVVGPWVHETVANGGRDSRAKDAPMARVGPRSFPPRAFLEGRELVRRFHDACLDRGEGLGLPPVRLYLTGSDRWIDLPAWPPAVTTRTLRLRSGGQAGTGQLVSGPGGGQIELVHDPLDPVPTGVFEVDGRFLHTGLQPVDPTPFLDRAGVHVFTSAPLPGPLTLLGTVRLELDIASTAGHADVVAWLAEVDAAGDVITLGARGPAIARVDTLSTAPARARLAFSPLGHTVAAGHRLRLYLTSSAWPLTFPLPVSGTHTVALGGARPALLELPVYEAP